MSGFLGDRNDSSGRFLEILYLMEVQVAVDFSRHGIELAHGSFVLLDRWQAAFDGSDRRELCRCQVDIGAVAQTPT